MRLAKSKAETEEPTDWVAYKNQFFSAVMISRDGFDKGSMLNSKAYDKKEQEGKPVHYLKDCQLSWRLSSIQQAYTQAILNFITVQMTSTFSRK